MHSQKAALLVGIKTLTILVLSFGGYAETSIPWNLVMCSPGAYQPNTGQTECIESRLRDITSPSLRIFSKQFAPAGSYQSTAQQVHAFYDPDTW